MKINYLSFLAECPSGWKQNGEFCFSFKSNKKTWSEASLFCKSLFGSHLASVSSKDDDQHLRFFGKYKFLPVFLWILNDSRLFN